MATAKKPAAKQPAAKPLGPATEVTRPKRASSAASAFKSARIAKPAVATKAAAAPRKPRTPVKGGKARNMSESLTASKRLIPPKGGATVRMYRSGHGDCFLIAFDSDTPGDPAYVLIDCGYKPGSPRLINPNSDPPTIPQITTSIREATGDGHLDVAVITHEHQDHVNGITEKNFNGITIGKTWLAWTEKRGDELADELRERFKDKLLGLIAARNRLAANNDDERAKSIDEFLAFELGGDVDTSDRAGVTALLAAAADPTNSLNKRAMKLFRDRARDGVEFLRPHEEILAIPGASNVRVYALGPPRDADQLTDLNPRGGEAFHAMGFAAASPGNYFAAAARAAENGSCGESPFPKRYAIPMDQALSEPEYGPFFTQYYGHDSIPPGFAPRLGGPERSPDDEAADNPAWRRIDREWLYSAEQLALDMNDYTNNASLVLAFELGKGGKVLLFAADAQRGNWVSWGEKTWKDGDQTVSARDLLGRTVLYKVGHHGSHNATLNGTVADDKPNLGWMATGRYGQEFTAMITAVRAWAETQKGWDHPLKAIKDALLAKASGRVFQTDCDVAQMERPPQVTAADWDRFISRVRGDRLYFDCDVVP